MAPGDQSSPEVGWWKQLVQKTMSNGVKWKKGTLALVILCIFCVIGYSMLQYQSDPTGHMKLSPVRSFHIEGYTVWPKFEHKPVMDNAYFKKFCVPNGNYSITGLVGMLKIWYKSKDRLCQSMYDKFTTMFSLDGRKATVILPPEFQKTVRRWLGNNKGLFKEVYDQDVIHVRNKFTREHTIFNPLRDKRPQMPPDEPEDKYVEAMVNKTRDTCDFCRFKDYTAEHLFGRLESQYAFTASNIFKIDTLHAIAALRSHHPLNWSKVQFLDLLKLTIAWLEKAKKNNPQVDYPQLSWDVLPKCGASQVHPHMQIMFDPQRYHGWVEGWRRGAQEYNTVMNSNYYSDMISIYSALNLTATYGTATAYANIVPRKDHEVIVMAPEANSDFFHLTYFVLRGFVDDLHKRCFSMGLAYPALANPAGRIPAYARIITRGIVTDIRADISSLELFLAANVNIDPYKTIQIVRDSVNKRVNTAS